MTIVSSSIGTFPSGFGQKEVIESIDENIILADRDYNVQWANPAATSFLQKVASLFGASDENAIIGMNMSHFHRKPEKQRNIMANLTHTHKAVIQIKDVYTAEIIVNPIRNEKKDISGYSILLMDVTERLKEQEEREKIIEDLSVPILKIWTSVLAVPLKGALSNERQAILTEQLMEACVRQGAKYVLLDLSGVGVEDDWMVERLNQLQHGLKLIGTTPITVGISSRLALSLSKIDTRVNWKTFANIEQGIRYILAFENMDIIE